MKLKSFQLFLLLLGIPVIFQFVAIGMIISSINLSEILVRCLTNPASMIVDIYSIIPVELVAAFSIVVILFVTLVFCWFYSLGSSLYKKLPQTVKMNLTGFKILLFLSAVYKVFASVYLLFLFSRISAGGEINLKILAYLSPLYLLSACCTFYCFYFIAKALKTVEQQKPVTFGDFKTEFFMVWIFPIGIWFIQPRVNRLFDSLSNGKNQALADTTI
jgi:hypothetical protein